MREAVTAVTRDAETRDMPSQAVTTTARDVTTHHAATTSTAMMVTLETVASMNRTAAVDALSLQACVALRQIITADAALAHMATLEATARSTYHADTVQMFLMCR